MWQTILMVIAVYLVVSGIVGIVSKIINSIIHNIDVKFWIQIFEITIGLSYLIWYCN